MKLNKKKMGLLFLCAGMLAVSGCSSTEIDIGNGITAVAELATLKCYYHNVSKVEETAGGTIKSLLNIGYKKYWLEYCGIITYGIDASKVEIISGPDEDGNITISMPDAEVLDIDLDESSMEEPLTDTGFLTEVTTEEKTEALAGAQEAMETAAVENTAYLNEAKERAKELIEEYLTNLGNELGQEYVITWVDAE